MSNSVLTQANYLINMDETPLLHNTSHSIVQHQLAILKYFLLKLLTSGSKVNLE